jgi:SAM-dependent methyltransferase
MPADCHVLDVGSKSGQAGFLFSLEGYNVQMLEPTKTWADFTKNELNIPTVQGYYDPDTFSPNTFDLVFAGGVVHRVDPPPLFFEAARNSVKIGGLIYCREPNLFNLARSNMQDLHRAYFTPYSFIRLCEENGFEVIDWINWSMQPKPHPGKNNYSVLAIRTDGNPKIISIPKPSKWDAHLAIISTMLGIRYNIPLERKRMFAIIGFFLSKLVGLKLAFQIIRVYGIIPISLRKIAQKLSFRNYN